MFIYFSVVEKGEIQWDNNEDFEVEGIMDMCVEKEKVSAILGEVE